jgi:SAM-dependent methyltransferase
MGRLYRFGRDWNQLGKQNPFGAILTGSAGELPQWRVDEFFDTGRVDADRFLADLARIAPNVPMSRVLDFGCGVGRVTRALARHFETSVGVDIAPSMIARAMSLNQSFCNSSFRVARTPELREIETAVYEVVYSRLVLQHIPPALIGRYIRALIRVLAPGGVLMFQMPEEIAPEPEDVFLGAPVIGGVLKSHLPRVIVHTYRRIKYRFIVDESTPSMAMFGMAKESVIQIVTEAGARILAIEPDHSHGVAVPGFEYWVTK